MRTPNETPFDAQAAFKTAIGFAATLYQRRSSGPAFAIARNEAGDNITIFDSKPGDKANALEQIRHAAPALARKLNAYAVTFGATALIAAPRDDRETTQLSKDLAAGGSLADHAGSVPALLLEHHTKTRITRAAFLIDQQGDIRPEPRLVTSAPASEAKPTAGIRFFPT